MRMVTDELRWVKRRPTGWRWAIAALYGVVGHSLAECWSVPPSDPLHHLTELFVVALKEVPELAPMQAGIEALEVFRTTWLSEPMHRWPVTPKEMPALFLNCLSVVERLGQPAGLTEEVRRAAEIVSEINEQLA